MYREDARRKRRNLFFATVIVVLLFIVDVVSGGVIRKPLRIVASSMWRDTIALFSGIAHSGIFASRAQLEHENQVLRAQIASMQDQITSAQTVFQQDKALQAAVRLAQSVSGVTAPVVSSFKTSPYGTFYAGAGEADGIKQGSIVLSLDGSAIGVVQEATQHQSLVKELFAPGESVDALIGTIPLTLHGQGGGNAMGDAPRDAKINTGTLIFSPTDAAHAIGIVGKAEGGPTSASVKVYARSLTNIESLSFVYIIP